MKERLEINNFGPIKEACIEVNKYTVFIGESSSGKSIIMKILAFCKWLQKEANLAYLLKDIIGDKKLYNKNLNKLKNIDQLQKSALLEFIKQDTNIVYYGNNYLIEININSINIKHLNNDSYLEKVTFISDDRFVIPSFMQGAQVDGLIPYYAKNMYSKFIEAFEDIKKLKGKILDYTIGKRKDESGIERLFVKKDNAEIGYYNASSGIKSLSVIETIIVHLNNTTFKNMFFLKYMLKNDKLPDIDKYFEISQALSPIKEKKYLCLEEPELSLFPKHQFELMKYLIEQANKNNDLNYVFSTHSPYIISALNNLIKASEIIKKFPEKTDKVREIIKTNALINIDEINAYLVKDGYVNNIIDNEFGIITADSIDDVGECLSLMYEDLLEILHEDF